MEITEESIITLDQKSWGICGFVAAIQAAVYNGNSGRVETVIKNNKDPEETNPDRAIILPVIQAFLNYAGTARLNDLLGFTSSFGKKYESKDFFIDTENKLVKDNMTKDLGIAMNPAGMDFLLKSILGTTLNPPRATPTIIKPTDLKGNQVLGLCDPLNSDPQNYYSLRHWVYVPYAKPGEHMRCLSWGNEERLVDLLDRSNYVIRHSLDMV